jgi:transketolase
VSMPSFELFEQQDASYRDSILPPAVGAVSRSRQVRGYRGTDGWGWTEILSALTGLGLRNDPRACSSISILPVEHVVERADKLLQG